MTEQNIFVDKLYLWSNISDSWCLVHCYLDKQIRFQWRRIKKTTTKLQKVIFLINFFHVCIIYVYISLSKCNNVEYSSLLLLQNLFCFIKCVWKISAWTKKIAEISQPLFIGSCLLSKSKWRSKFQVKVIKQNSDLS